VTAPRPAARALASPPSSALASASVSARDAPPVFLCDLFGAAPKGDLASMEHPLFSLATRPDLGIMRYAHNGTDVTVTPSVRGRATMHDKDILIYCTGQLMAALNAGRATARTLTLVAHDLLTATRRETSGDAYRRLIEAFERLAGTRITTNILTGSGPDALETTAGFGLIEAWEVVRKTRGGRMVQVRVTLSDWLYRAILARSVLTLNRDYFTLRRPLERRLYELCRKHCGQQAEWRISLALLQKKAGSLSPQRVFRAMLREVAAKGNLPDYRLVLDAGDILTVTPRIAPVDQQIGQGIGQGIGQLGPILSEAARDRARALIAERAPGHDVHALEAEWRGFWVRSGRRRLVMPDRAFLGWLDRRLSDRT